MKILVIFLTIIVFLIFAVLGRAESVPQPQRSPNILFILTDDQRWDSMGCYGNKSIRTPNFDKLASEGARFDACYVAGPLCCPSRASFLTGLYPHQIGVTANMDKLPDSVPTVADFLNDAGYVTGFIGKAHLNGDPRLWGFKDCPVYFPLGSVEAQRSRKRDPENYIFVNNEKKKIEGNLTETFANAAISFVEKHKNEKWFLWFATTAPHAPFLNYPRHPYSVSDIQAPPGWPTHQLFKPNRNIAEYYSTISMLDEQIGRILKKLEDLGLTQNTFVFLASDNGFMLGSHGKHAKNVWFEESIRVPALARWPGRIKPKTEVKSLVSNIDFLPTVLEVTGINKKIRGSSGLSMLGPLSGNASARKEIFSEVELSTRRFQMWQMIRNEHFKYVRFQDGKEHLYNLKEDPFESKDLMKTKAPPTVKEELTARLKRWIDETPIIAERVKDRMKNREHQIKDSSDEL